MKKKILISILSVILVVSMMPLGVFAQASKQSNEPFEYNWNMKEIATAYGIVSEHWNKIPEELSPIDELEMAYISGGNRENTSGLIGDWDNYDIEREAVRFTTDTPVDQEFAHHFIEVDVPEEYFIKTFSATACWVNEGGPVQTNDTPSIVVYGENLEGEYEVVQTVELTQEFQNINFDKLNGHGGPIYLTFKNITEKTSIEIKDMNIEAGEMCLITFISDDDVYDLQGVAEGEYATEPEAPTKEGYKFTGWFLTPDATGTAFDFENTPIDDDITLYAGWTKDETPTPAPTPSDKGTGTNGQGTSAATGDNMMPIIFIGVGIIAGISGFIAYRKLRNR